MNTEALSIYDEITTIPWTIQDPDAFRLTTEKGQALYWEWKPVYDTSGAEDFLIFTRTAFPNGGSVCRKHSNHALVWKIYEDDIYGVGLRKLRHRSTWVVSIVEIPPSDARVSLCPDRELNLKAVRFFAEEFLRGIDPIDIYKADTSIASENTSWWNYLEKLERIINWKYPEVKLFKQTNPEITINNHDRRGDRDNRSFTEEVVAKRSSDDYKHGYSTSARWSQRERSRPDRSRSPVRRFAPLETEQLKPDLAGGTTRQEITCHTCQVSFDYSFELMRHYNTEEHRQNLLKEFPI
jgi:hypothetical protein